MSTLDCLKLFNHFSNERTDQNIKLKVSIISILTYSKISDSDKISKINKLLVDHADTNLNSLILLEDKIKNFPITSSNLISASRKIL